MIVSHFPHGPTVYFTLNNVSLRHDIGTYKNSTVSEQYPHLIFENFSSKLGERVRDILKYLFPVPKEDSKRVMTFSNEDDFISFRYVVTPGRIVYLLIPSTSHHVFVKIPRQVQLAEVGPRFEMKRNYKVFLQIPSQTLTPDSKRTRSGKARWNKQRQNGNGSSRIILVPPKNVACSQGPTRYLLSLLRKKQGDSRPILDLTRMASAFHWARYPQQGPSPSIQDIQTALLYIRSCFAFLRTNDRDRVPDCGSGLFWVCCVDCILILVLYKYSCIASRYKILNQQSNPCPEWRTLQRMS